jgi:hypothetical protein
LALAANGCQSNDAGDAGCQLSQEAELGGSPLTLLPNARLDRVGAGFALSGVDTTAVRWAALDAAGTLGTEHALTVTPSPSGPWLAFTASATPGDTLLVAQAQAAANGTDAELHVFTTPASDAASTMPGAPAPGAPALGPTLATIPRALSAGAEPGIVLGASRSGAHAALAWLDPGAGGVELLLLSPSGQPVGAPTVLERAPSFDCLAFAPGKDALTVVYYRYPDATSRIPTLVITELLETGAIDETVELSLDSHAARCPTLTPTDAGYSFAFEDDEGVWLGVFEASAQALSITPFAAAVGLGGAAFLPPIEGLAPLGTDYGVVFARTYGGELWRLDGAGHRRSGALVFPSQKGSIGAISTQSGTGALFATYADYSSVDAGVGTAGQRYFIGATCL